MLTSLAQYKSFFNVTDSTKDNQLNALLQAADSAVKDYCQDTFEQATYTQYLSGNNTERVVLPQVPVQSVTALYLNNSGYYGTNSSFPFDSSTQLIEGVDWVLDHDQPDGSSKSGILFRIGTVWPILYQINSLNLLTPFQGPCRGNIKVQYTAGYATIPMDLQYATCLLVEYMLRTQKFGGFLATSEKLGQYAYSLFVDPAHQYQVGSILEILGRYKETGW